MGVMSMLKSFIPGMTEEKKPDELAFQADDPKELMDELKKEIQSELQAKAGEERSWFMNIAFMMGKHYVQWQESTKKFISQKVPDWRVRLTVNKILPRYRKNLALLDSYDPKTVCTPNSTEIVDIEAAILGTKILQGLKESLKMRMLMHRKNQWQLLCGNGFITLPYWDESKGQDIPLTRDVPVTDPMTGTMTMTTEDTGETVKTGDLGAEAVSPFELIPLGNCDSIETCQGMARVKVTTINEIRKLYPEAGAKITPESDVSTTGMYMEKINSLSGMGVGAGNADRDKDTTTYIRVYLRPTPKFPQGRYLAYANDEVLEYGDIPYIELGPEFEIPFLKYDDITIPSRFWAQATIEQQIPLNKEVNKTHSQLIEIKNLMAKPKWIAVKDSVAKTAITSEPGEVIEWNPTVAGAQAPHSETPHPFDNGVFQILTLLDKAIADIGATHDASMGEVPSGVKSGAGLRELKASDSQEKSSYFIQEDENRKIFASAALKLVQAKYTEPRMLKIMGEGGVSEVRSFMGAELRGNTDVWKEGSDIVPMEREERQKFIMDLYKTGMLGRADDDETRKRALRMLQFGMLDEMWEEGSLDAKYARNENKEMSKGVRQDVQFFDNHDTHILVVLQAIKNAGFKEQPPEIQLLFVDHLKVHQNALVPPPPPPGVVPAGAPPGEGVQ